jgi:hypothetical protein
MELQPSTVGISSLPRNYNETRNNKLQASGVSSLVLTSGETQNSAPIQQLSVTELRSYRPDRVSIAGCPGLPQDQKGGPGPRSTPAETIRHRVGHCCSHCNRFFDSRDGYVYRGRFYCEECVWLLADNGEFY